MAELEKLAVLFFTELGAELGAVAAGLLMSALAGWVAYARGGKRRRKEPGE